MYARLSVAPTPHRASRSPVPFRLLPTSHSQAPPKGRNPSGYQGKARQKPQIYTPPTTKSKVRLETQNPMCKFHSKTDGRRGSQNRETKQDLKWI